MKGTLEKRVGPVRLCCISPEARDLLDRIMEEWEEHYAALKKTIGPHYEPSYYGFAYWLVRWSGLIEPAVTRPSGALGGAEGVTPPTPSEGAES